MPDDCTPWVLGGLWPAVLDNVTPETAPIADYLKRDLQRIADSANHKLRILHETPMPDAVRATEQNRVVDSARAFAVQRVESTMRQLHNQAVEATQVLPSLGPHTDEPTRAMPRLPTPPAEEPAEPAVHEPGEQEPAEQAQPETPEQRLRRMVDMLARQEPGLRWAAGLRPDGTTVVVTDLAYGWVPPGIVLPPGTEVPAPEKRAGSLRALLGVTETAVRYNPGDPFTGGRAIDSGDAPGAMSAPEIDDLGWLLSEATRWREGLPRITHTLARAAAAGTGVVDAELDVLRVHLDTARYQLLSRYPATDSALLLNCLLLAATTALAAGDRDAANYHFAWFIECNRSPSGNAAHTS